MKNNRNAMVQSMVNKLKYESPLRSELVNNNSATEIDYQKKSGNLKKIFRHSIKEGMNLLGASYNGRERIYLLCSSENGSKLHLIICSVLQEKLITNVLVGELTGEGRLSTKASAEAFLFRDDAIYWYLLTNNNNNKIVVFKISLDSKISGEFLSKDNMGIFQDISKSFPFNNFDLPGTKDATLSVLSGYPYLAGGFIKDKTVNLSVTLLGNYLGSWSMNYLIYARKNPLINPVGNSVYYTGGIVEETEPLIEFLPVAWLKPQKDQLGPMQAYGLHAIHNVPYPVVDYSEMKKMNALNTGSCVLNSAIYFFPKTLFDSEKTFYKYETSANSFTLYKIPESAQLSPIKYIDNIKTVVIDNYIYIILWGENEHGKSKKVELYKLNPYSKVFNV